MAGETDLQADMDLIKALVQKQADAIALLGANQATPVMTQAQLDTLDAEAKAILATVPTPPSTTATTGTAPAGTDTGTTAAPETASDGSASIRNAV